MRGVRCGRRRARPGRRRRPARSGPRLVWRTAGCGGSCHPLSAPFALPGLLSGAMSGGGGAAAGAVPLGVVPRAVGVAALGAGPVRLAPPPSEDGGALVGGLAAPHAVGCAPGLTGERVVEA